MRKDRDAARALVPAVAIANFPAADAEGEDFTPLTLQRPTSGGLLPEQPNTSQSHFPLCTCTPTATPASAGLPEKGGRASVNGDQLETRSDVTRRTVRFQATQLEGKLSVSLN